MWISFILFLVAAAVFAWWWRARGGREEKDLVAKENHRSVRKFHYGPAPVLAPLEAAPPLAPDNLLSQLLPEEDFKAKEELEIEAEAARVEAEQMAEREPLSEPAPVVAPVVAPVAAAAEGVTESAPALVEEPTATPAPVLLSSRYAPEATVNVHDYIGNEEPAADVPVVSEPVASEPVADVAVASEPVAAPALVAAADDAVSEAIYDNPVSPTSAAPTKNDEANRQAAVELRQRKRVALQARLDSQKTAMSAFTTDNKKPR